MKKQDRIFLIITICLTLICCHAFKAEGRILNVDNIKTEIQNTKDDISDVENEIESWSYYLDELRKLESLQNNLGN